MDLPFHEITVKLIVVLLRGDQADDLLINEALDHIASCPECLQEVLKTVHLVKNLPDILKFWIGSEQNCQVFQPLLGEYAEMDESQAGQYYPLVFEHLQHCTSCQSEVDLIRSLINSTEELGSLPGAGNTRIIEPAAPGEPLKIILNSLTRVRWQKHKSIIDVVLKSIPAGLANGFTGLQGQALVPAFLGPVQDEIQTLKYRMPQQLDVDMNISHSGQLFDLNLKASLLCESESLLVKIFIIENGEPLLLISQSIKNQSPCLFSRLNQGRYEVHIEANQTDSSTVWQIPFELAGDGVCGS
ncbi:MAG: hypothetical protein ABFD04_00980 [Syntrophomonas sp.]